MKLLEEIDAVLKDPVVVSRIDLVDLLRRCRLALVAKEFQTKCLREHIAELEK